MRKRTFIKLSVTAAAGAALAPGLTFCAGNDTDTANQNSTESLPPASPFVLPELPYTYTALEPHIDSMTMEIHHGKHHAAYTNNLNNAITGNSRFDGKSIEEIMKLISPDEADKVVRNNGGGYYNHNLFWNILSPSGGGDPAGVLAEAISTSFGGWNQCREALVKAAMTVFGSGWAWLCVNSDKKLYITSTPNQDNPLMVQVAKDPGMPVLGIDVWEHAYYLKHQNKRADYLDAIFNVINWEQVQALYKKATGN